MAWRVGAKGSRRAQGWGATPGPQRGAELGLHSCSGQGDPTAGTPRALPGRGALICSGLGAARGGPSSPPSPRGLRGGCQAPPATTAMATPRGSHRCSAEEGLIQTRSPPSPPPPCTPMCRCSASPGCEPACIPGSEKPPPAPRRANLPPLLRATPPTPRPLPGVPPPTPGCSPASLEAPALPGSPALHEPGRPEPGRIQAGRNRSLPRAPPRCGPPPNPPCTGVAGRGPLPRPATEPFRPPRTG